MSTWAGPLAGEHERKWGPMNDLDDVLRSMTFDFFGKGRHKTTPLQLLAAEGAVFLDVRSPDEVARVPLPLANDVCAMHIPIHELPDRWSEVPRDRLVGVFCASDIRSSVAYAYLRCRGHENVRIVTGGYAALLEELKPGRIWARCAAGAASPCPHGAGSRAT